MRVESLEKEWITYTHTPTRTGNTTFTIPTDVTAVYTVGRRIRCTDSSTIYGTITASSYSAPNTTVTISSDSGNLSASLSAVAVGASKAASNAIPYLFRQATDVASDTTINLDTVNGFLVDVTGTTAITTVTLAQGQVRIVRFTGALTFTHGSSLVLPGAANITTAAGDYAILAGYASSVVRCISYVKASGLGVAGMAAQAASSVAITGGSVTGLTALTLSGSGSPAASLTQTAQSNNGLVLSASNASYDGNILQPSSTRAASSAFDHIEALANSGGDVTFRARGDGTITADISFTGGGADYAEYFESASTAAIATGTSVVLTGHKVRPATEDDPPESILGVVRPKLGAAGVIGNAAELAWQGKYERDAYGGLLLEPNGDLKRSAGFDPEAEYTPRSERPEWCLVGLLGQVRIAKGQPTGSRWIKMRDVSETVEEWFVR